MRRAVVAMRRITGLPRDFQVMRIWDNANYWVLDSIDVRRGDEHARAFWTIDTIDTDDYYWPPSGTKLW